LKKVWIFWKRRWLVKLTVREKGKYFEFYFAK
jgi:hypothetical protein